MNSKKIAIATSPWERVEVVYNAEKGVMYVSRVTETSTMIVKHGKHFESMLEALNFIKTVYDEETANMVIAKMIKHNN